MFFFRQNHSVCDFIYQNSAWDDWFVDKGRETLSFQWEYEMSFSIKYGKLHLKWAKFLTFYMYTIWKKKKIVKTWIVIRWQIWFSLVDFEIRNFWVKSQNCKIYVCTYITLIPNLLIRCGSTSVKESNWTIQGMVTWSTSLTFGSLDRNYYYSHSKAG